MRIFTALSPSGKCLGKRQLGNIKDEGEKGKPLVRVGRKATGPGSLGRLSCHQRFYVYRDLWFATKPRIFFCGLVRNLIEIRKEVQS